MRFILPNKFETHMYINGAEPRNLKLDAKIYYCEQQESIYLGSCPCSHCRPYIIVEMTENKDTIWLEKE